MASKAGKLTAVANKLDSLVEAADTPLAKRPWDLCSDS